MRPTPKLLIGCALAKEVEILGDHMPLDCNYLVTGMGVRRTEAALMERFGSAKPALLIFTGTAGQLDPELEMGSVVLPEAWCFQDGPCFSAHAPLVSVLRQRGWEISGRGLTVPLPVVRKQARIELYQRFGACVCDMEAAVALKVASSFGVPCLAPKVISDTAGAALVSFWTHFNANMVKLADYLKNLLRALDVDERGAKEN